MTYVHTPESTHSNVLSNKRDKFLELVIPCTCTCENCPLHVQNEKKCILVWRMFNNLPIRTLTLIELKEDI